MTVRRSFKSRKNMRTAQGKTSRKNLCRILCPSELEKNPDVISEHRETFAVTIFS
ncbi:hypothetical protein LACDD01_01806 [Lactococcus sp. DD01]|nr:hypothetical protein LACDD01_01806 [Lactococcus sp. DD01]